MSPISMSKLETAIRATLEFNKACNQHNIPGMLQLLSADCVFESGQPAPDGASCRGREAIGLFWEDFFRTWPQSHFAIEEVFSLGAHCILRWKCEWQEPGGEQKHLRGVDLFQVQEGLICAQMTYVKSDRVDEDRMA